MATGPDYAALRAEQEDLALMVRLEDEDEEPETIAGFDAAYHEETGIGALVIMDAEGTEVLEAHVIQEPVSMPYVPGYLAYREFPLLKKAWSMKKHDVDLLLIDGAGTIHPRRTGSATHAGIKLDVPTIGVTKRLFLGTVEGPLPETGDNAPIVDEEGILLGYAYRSSPRTEKPIYISPGHRITYETALKTAARLCTGKHRLPEPLRLAHEAAAEEKKRLTE